MTYISHEKDLEIPFFFPLEIKYENYCQVIPEVFFGQSV